jgi:superfamily II DNA or RNA helicase
MLALEYWLSYGRQPVAKEGGWRRQLWPHQRGALALIRRYLGADPPVVGSALIRLPTGTGKSGVIAVSAHVLVRSGHVLVLAPWDNLVEQLIRDIERRFWERIGTTAPSRRPVVRLLPSTTDAALTKAKQTPTIFVSTIVTLEALHRAEEQGPYRRLAKAVGAVFVDEGHREPAPNWSRAVRELGRPTVLFTATPYRNDFQFFRVHKDYFFSYSHEQAEADHFIRQVTFQPMRWSGPDDLARELISFCRRTFGTRAQPRVIVRCETQEQVKAVTDALLTRGASAMGVHDRFATGDGALRHDVPDADRTDLPQYWVHQYKLIEGIDNPSFRVLAIYDAMRNDRAFVQQVGRVLRNPTRGANEQAWVLSRPEEQLSESWDVYRTYDRDPRTSTYATLATSADLVRAQPLRYLAGRFRAPFDLHADDTHGEFDYPRAAQVFLVPATFDLNSLAAAVEEEWNAADRELGGVREPDPATRVHPYIARQLSPLLLRTAFTEETVGVTIYRRVHRYLFYYDTQGRLPDVLITTPRIAPGELERLYVGAAARLSGVSLRNTSLGRHDVRRRTLQAYAIDELAPDLADHAHFASTATGYTLDGTTLAQRYVGFTRARVRDRGAGPTPFDDYVAWVDRVAAELDATGTQPLRVFDRYAEVVSEPADVRPANILLDFDQALFRESPQAAGATNASLQIDDLCVPVDPQGLFRCTANGRTYDVQITWVPNTRSYRLANQELDDDYVSVAVVRRPRSLLAYLNQTQAFRVLPRNTHRIYSRGRFYKTRVPLWGTMAGKLELLTILEPIQHLAAMTSEKGDVVRASGAGWAAGSLFNLIDSRGVGTAFAEAMANVALLVCDDGNTEIADFIALDPTARRVIGIHAKAFARPRQLSAGALHEVGMQALKNLGSFQPFSVGKPDNLARWDRPWRDAHVVGTVTRRIRDGNDTGAVAWRRIRGALRDPLWTREIWLVLGAGLSRQQLAARQASNEPTPETIQVLYALQAIWSSVQSTGARLRIFCSP